jgi:hypothetical protein
MVFVAITVGFVLSRGVFPTISSMRNILGVMWNFSLGCSIVCSVSRSPYSSLSLAYDADGPIPMLLPAACTVITEISSANGYRNPTYPNTY